MDKISIIRKIIRNIKSNPTFSTIFAMQELFNNIGLTVFETPKSRAIISKVKNGKPYLNEVVDDYIFLGKIDDEIIDKTIVPCIKEFVLAAAGDPIEPEQMKDWQKSQNGIYGRVISIIHEDINAITQDLNNTVIIG